MMNLRCGLILLLAAFTNAETICPVQDAITVAQCFHTSFGADFPNVDVASFMLSRLTSQTAGSFCTGFDAFKACVDSGKAFPDEGRVRLDCTPTSHRHGQVMTVGRDFYLQFSHLCERGYHDLMEGIDCLAAEYQAREAGCARRGFVAANALEVEDNVFELSPVERRCLAVEVMRSCSQRVTEETCGRGGLKLVEGLWLARKPMFAECDNTEMDK